MNEQSLLPCLHVSFYSAVIPNLLNYYSDLQ